MAVGRPRVEIKEFDKSTSIEGSPLYSVGLVGFAEKGPVNVPTLITNMQQYQDVFGSLTWANEYPSASYLKYAAKYFLDVASQAWIVRGDVANAAFAWIDIRSSSGWGSGYTISGLGTSAMSAFYLTGTDVMSAQDSRGFPTAAPNGSNNILRVFARYKGDYANALYRIATFNYQFYKDASAASGMSYAPSIDTKPSNYDEFVLMVYDSESNTPLESYLLSMKRGARDAKGRNIYVEDVVNENSKYIYCLTNGAFSDPSATLASGNTIPGPNFAEWMTCGYSAPVVLGLAANSGTCTTQFGSYEPSAAQANMDDLANSLDLLSNQTDYTIRGLYAPGCTVESAPAAVAKVFTVADSRLDCVGIVDMPRKTAADNVDIDKLAMGANSTHAARYSNWWKAYDYENDKYIYLPPGIQALRAHAKTWRDYGFFYAPAGKTRGALVDVVELDYKYTDGELDYLATNQINPLAKLKFEGNVIWGQKTAWPLASDFRDINIRYTFIYIEQAIAQYARNLIFEFNNGPTRNMAQLTVNKFLKSLQSQGAIEWFKVVCDSINNTEQVIDNNELVIDCYIQATKVAEVIKLNFYATRQSLEIGRG